MIEFKQKGNFDDLTRYLKKIKNVSKEIDLDRFGRAGVDALASATPYDTGRTSRSWYYEIKNQNGVASISFHNSNSNNGVPIAIILQYGHGTRNGGWVEGRDYINPAIQPIFDNLAESAWKEVARA